MTRQQLQLNSWQYSQINPQFLEGSYTLDNKMTEYVIIIRDGEAAKACYRIEASDTQLAMLKEMVKAGVYVLRETI